MSYAAPRRHWDLPRTDDMRAPGSRLQQVLRPAGRAWFARRYDIHQHGVEHVPATGPVVLASNHIGLLDGPLMTAFTPRPVHAMVKREMFEGATGRFLLAVGQIPLRRFEVDAGAIKACVRVLRDGGVVGVYPEGRRGDGEFRDLRGGVAYLALVTGAPVVPLAVFGTRERGGHSDSVPPKGARFDFVYGPPVYLDAQPWPRTQSDVRRVTASLRNTFREHLVEAMATTGRTLPGPLPTPTQAEILQGLSGMKDER
ncbi:MAG: lysophospholipid acyltransferase family protein [Nocardioidaceae bacterium]